MQSVVALSVLAYLAGSIPTGVLLARIAGVDVRREGSGNIGATNVARSAGRSLGVLTLIGDALKGFLPVLAAATLDGRETAIAATAAAAVVGHVFSVFLGFRGGKGVATGAGALLGIAPLAALPALAIFACVVAMSRAVSLASIVASASAAVAIFLFGYSTPRIVAGISIALLIISRHRENISRLVAGTERLWGQRGHS